ncbi:hypothetical protein PQX77_011966 [Marasmius sp. AFHP31]|nr:hypothetical protein PQX77_011966 [Marasmius sp. AFHP31]
MSRTKSNRTIFFLGATGFLGSEVLISLARDLPNFHVRALVRAPVKDREARLKAIYRDLSVVEGTLEDAVMIEEEVVKANFIINCASSDHLPCVKAILRGSEKNSANNPGRAPLYIHVSGLGVTSDNCRGEHVDLEHIHPYTDVGFTLEDCPPHNTHLESDKPIVQAGTKRKNPIRTIVLFPGWIYGIGRGIQKSTLPVRHYIELAKTAGHAGTWGKGHNRMNNIHVRDCADAVVAVFKAALEGKADEGAEGLCKGSSHLTDESTDMRVALDFAVSNEPMVTNGEIVAKIGDVMHANGFIKEPGSRPLPDKLVDPLGFCKFIFNDQSCSYDGINLSVGDWTDCWSLMAGNHIARPQRLFKLGWEPTETKKTSLMDSLGDEIELALRNGAEYRSLKSGAVDDPSSASANV